MDECQYIQYYALEGKIKFILFLHFNNYTPNMHYTTEHSVYLQSL